MTALEQLVSRLPGDQRHLLDVSNPEELLRDSESIEIGYPGGLLAYVATAKKLLDQLISGDTTTVVDVRPGPTIKAPSLLDEASSCKAAEIAALPSLRRTAFVLVAGGLGERLGFNGIKLSLPIDTVCGLTYMQHYADWVRTVCGVDTPFVLMTSDDTHARTVDLLKLHNNFGLADVILLKQETVPCLMNGNASLSLRPGSSSLMRKPHGHGDIHHLLHRAALPSQWAAKGYEFVVFLQDTNAAVTLTVPQSLHAMQVENLDMLFTCVRRQQGEAVGALSSAVTVPDGHRRVINVEYNVFDSAYKAAAANSDAAGKPEDYPGSINTLILRLDTYIDVLRTTGGRVPEFINPKFADSSRTNFKSPTRVESLMQDIALVLPSTAHVKGILFDNDMYCPVKNNFAEALSRAAAGASTHCAASGEEAVLNQRRMMLTAIGVQVGHSVPECSTPIRGALKVNLFPAIAFDAAFGATLGQLAERFPAPPGVVISSRSVLRIAGDVVIESLTLDGALVLEAAPGASITVCGLEVTNQGWEVEVVDNAPDEITAIRGYRFVPKETLTVRAEVGQHLTVGPLSAAHM